MTYALSPTGLNLFLDCPRCFWFHYQKGLQRPRGPFPSLPGGMDRVIKTYFDGYRRRKKLPPELEGKVKGRLFDDEGVLAEWRNWRRGLVYQEPALDATLTGALDECLVNEADYIPVDYKTKGSAPTQADAEKYYRNQLDCYCFLLEANRRPTCSLGYLVYYSPSKVEGSGVVRFQIDLIRMETDPLRAKSVFEKAVKLLSGGMPAGRPGCEYCLFREKNA